MEFEPLRPNLNEDPAFQEKRAKAAKLKAYSKELDRLNKMALAKQPKYRSPSPPPKQPTRLDKARVYAQTIPAPRQKSRGAAAAVVEAAAAPAPVFASDGRGSTRRTTTSTTATSTSRRAWSSSSCSTTSGARPRRRSGGRMGFRLTSWFTICVQVRMIRRALRPRCVPGQIPRAVVVRGESTSQPVRRWPRGIRLSRGDRC